jgi:hypothetical protein
MVEERLNVMQAIRFKFAYIYLVCAQEIIITDTEFNSNSPVNPSIIMAAVWDPRNLLEVDPTGVAPCVGTTQKGRRCGQSCYFFSPSDLNEASKLLDKMAASQPADVRAELRLLADYTLCPRHHRNSRNAVTVTRTWWTTITSFYPDGVAPVPTSSATQDSDSEEEATGRDTRTTGSALLGEALPTPPQSPSPAPLALSPASSATVATEITQVVVSAPAAEPPTDTMHPSASSSATTALATPPVSPLPPQSPTLLPATDQEEVEATTPPTTASTAEALSSQTTPLTPRSVCPPTATTWLQLTPEPRSPIKATPCPHSSRRKPLADECPICNEEIHCPDDAVWCRAQCGQNMHRGCFAPWRRECLDREATVTCVYCRAPWKYEWEE